MAHSSLVQTPCSKTSSRIVGVQEAVRMNPSRVELSSVVINCLVGGNVTDLRTDRPSASNVGLPDLACRATEASSERPQVSVQGLLPLHRDARYPVNGPDQRKGDRIRSLCDPQDTKSTRWQTMTASNSAAHSGKATLKSVSQRGERHHNTHVQPAA